MDKCNCSVRLFPSKQGLDEREGFSFTIIIHLNIRETCAGIEQRQLLQQPAGSRFMVWQVFCTHDSVRSMRVHNKHEKSCDKLFIVCCLHQLPEFLLHLVVKNENCNMRS